MAKIKRKKEMTLVELIEYGFKNNFKNVKIVSSTDCTMYVRFEEEGDISCPSHITPNETFKIEVEEEITGDTILPEVVEFYVNGSGTQYSQRSINGLKDSLSKEFWLKDGDTMTLIWKDGELV